MCAPQAYPGVPRFGNGARVIDSVTRSFGGEISGSALRIVELADRAEGILGNPDSRNMRELNPATYVSRELPQACPSEQLRITH